MLKADELREILKNEYGIFSDAELEAAINNMQRVNIELFVVVQEKGQESDGTMSIKNKGISPYSSLYCFYFTSKTILIATGFTSLTCFSLI